MGNSGSQQTGNSTQRTGPLEEQQWTQSFPRSQNQHQHKLIVPDRDAHQRLRPTGNGEILHSGGTISGRNNQWHGHGVSRSSSISGVKEYRSQSPQQRTRSAHKHNCSRALAPSYRNEQMKRFGSEPDLRFSSKQQEHDRYKGRKKYKAPPPPPAITAVDRNGIIEENYCITNGSPIRRARLFKTRAETKKKISSPVINRTSVNSIPESIPQDSNFNCISERNDNNFNNIVNNNNNIKSPNKYNIPPIPCMQRSRSSPEFEAELREATRRLVHLKTERKVINNEKIQNDNKLKTLDHNLNKIRKNIKKDVDKSTVFSEERSPAVGKESSPEQTPPKVKTFYFGMELENNNKISNSLESDTSSESETEITANDISLQLRPILPKKQLEIPRFSPAAAWKLLSAVDTNNAESMVASEESTIFVEEKIEKLSRPPPPFRPNGGSRSNNDKSGDSGISGDETPEAVMPSPKHRAISWTPQQDLGDDSSLEEGSNPDLQNTNKFSSKPHVFSLSLPRENHLSTYINEKSVQPYSSLQKFKQSMSGMLNTLTNKKYLEFEQDLSENWFFSRSAPNSLNNGFNSLELRRQNLETDELENSGLIHTNTKRIMYLPQSNLEALRRKKQVSKSYENISVDQSYPQNLQDPPKVEPIRWTNKKTKKFTFQSTVRQIERKRLADRLSKEAERKEQQRLRELEAMQKVEEEFQKKRAREKASIRHQLRLYSMEDSPWSSLPPNVGIADEVRPEPDGANSSSASSPVFSKNHSESKENKTPTTQVLSEFRQPQREYKEFRSGTRYLSEQTVHPRVTCNMPKASGTSHAGNYRKDFAHGIKTAESNS